MLVLSCYVYAACRDSLFKARTALPILLLFRGQSRNRTCQSKGECASTSGFETRRSHDNPGAAAREDNNTDSSIVSHALAVDGRISKAPPESQGGACGNDYPQVLFIYQAFPAWLTGGVDMDGLMYHL